MRTERNNHFPVKCTCLEARRWARREARWKLISFLGSPSRREIKDKEQRKLAETLLSPITIRDDTVTESNHESRAKKLERKKLFRGFANNDSNAAGIDYQSNTDQMLQFQRPNVTLRIFRLRRYSRSVAEKLWKLRLNQYNSLWLSTQVIHRWIPQEWNSNSVT